MSAVEPDKPLPDIWIGVGYEHRRKSARINREWVQRDDSNTPTRADDIADLEFSEYEHRLNLDLRVGIFRDLELHVRAPIVLAYESSIDYATSAADSTFFGNGNFADNPAFAYRYPLTEVPASRQRAGFGDMTFGLGWSPFNDLKDEAYPTLTLNADVIAPTGARRDPTDQAALPNTDGRGSVGLGQTVFDLSLGLSRRMRTKTPLFDPYVIVGARIPVATPAQRDIGMDPPISGRVRVGAEVVMAENLSRRSRYAIDVSFGLRYISLGRTYSELSDYLPSFDQTRVPNDAVDYGDYDNPMNYANQLDGASCGKIQGVPCGELNRIDPHLEMQGQLALHIQPSQWFTFRAGVAVGFVSNHVITAERVGTDTDDPIADADAICGNGGQCVGRVNASNASNQDERSPYFDPRYDQPGRRLMAEGIFTLTAFATIAATF